MEISIVVLLGILAAGIGYYVGYIVTELHRIWYNANCYKKVEKLNNDN